ncbi:TonB-dependent receptor [Cyclobacterium sp. 1_MG-2023]|uniref:SusC/RagA family TonB-linked outer membrane protein n=1 Tax=Cyclobacterium sp. 1_MG-2023 TaxID=3062681 RepID=UPI0026E338DB|nr:TonB-dependent receptor [Cyclobacterium sp. 1_MG-2023]MDO6440404.1 TonB-dependent receptor [Cyclobacterium sp. 1_MG-2023]
MEKNVLRQLIMLSKRLLYAFLVQLFMCTIIMANTGNAQRKTIEDVKLSIDLDEKTLSRFFRLIENKTDFEFTYDHDLIDLKKKVSVEGDNLSLYKLLASVSLQTDLHFVQINDNIHVKLSSGILDQAIEIADLADVTITGTVKDANGEPIPGVTILLPGTTTGTTTDLDGKYSISVPEGSNLVFSFIGFETQKIPINDKSVIDVVLTEDTASLDEFVLVGYGMQKKSDVTGSVARVTTEKTEDLPNYSILQSLQGQVSGLNITSSDRPGKELEMTIRGVNSISASSSPLIVVDGVIYKGSLSDINTTTVESIDILKDASAAAVYGSRAANGVIIITTKTGMTEKPQFNFNSYTGIQTPDRIIEVLDGPGYLQKVLDFRESQGLDADMANIEDYLTVGEVENLRNGKTTDWMDLVTRTGVTNNYQLGVSGKSQNTNYFISTNYFKQNGIVLNDDFKRMSVNLNLSNHITDWLTISVKSMFSTRDMSGVPANFEQAPDQSPYGNVYDINGPGGYAFHPVGDPLGINPLINTTIKDYDKQTSLWGLFSSAMEVPFVPGLKWTMNASSNLRIAKQGQYLDNQSTSASINANGIGSKAITESHDWTIDNIINYQKVLNIDHSINMTFLYSREYSQLDYSSLMGRDFFTQSTGYDNLSIAQIQQIASNFENQNSVAYMGRVNYSYLDKYALTITARKDGFSGFSQGNKYATFPSAAFAWTASNEKFFSNLNWLDNLKVRLSYGKNGNQAVGRYQSLARMSSDQYLFDQTTTAIYTASMANNNLTWETTKSKNFGVDFSILANKVSGSIDIYSSNTEDLLLRRSLPSTSGFNSVFTNVGEVQNKGFELSVHTLNLKNNKSGLSWESSFLFWLNRNKIVKLTGADVNGDGVEDDDISNNWFIDEPINTLFGYKVDGIYQLEDELLPGFTPGDFRLIDLNEDGKITPEDRTILGNTMPNYSFSISNTFKYNNFGLYVLVNSIQGGNGSYLGDNMATRSVGRLSTSYAERFNLQNVPYWTPSRPSNLYSKINYYPTVPTLILEDRSFVRIQDISFSYIFNEGVLGEFNSLKLFASAKNLVTFTNWGGYDPENATVMRGGFPLMKSFTIGFDFKF